MKRFLLVACGMALCCSAQAERPVKVTFLGDVMCQGPMLKAYSAGDGKYDFSEVFAGVKGLLAESALAPLSSGSMNIGFFAVVVPKAGMTVLFR